jgi:hypothetical protein
MEKREIKKVGKKFWVSDEILGWIIIDKIEESDSLRSSDPLEYKAIVTIDDVEGLR